MRNGRTHETSRVGLVGSDLVVNHDESLLDDERNLSTGKGVLESVSEEDLNDNPNQRSVLESLAPRIARSFVLPPRALLCSLVTPPRLVLLEVLHSDKCDDGETYGQRKTLSELVGSRRRTRGVRSSKLVEHPAGRSRKTLQVLFRSTSLRKRNESSQQTVGDRDGTCAVVSGADSLANEHKFSLNSCFLLALAVLSLPSLVPPLALHHYGRLRLLHLPPVVQEEYLRAGPIFRFDDCWPRGPSSILASAGMTGKLRLPCLSAGGREKTRE